MTKITATIQEPLVALLEEFHTTSVAALIARGCKVVTCTTAYDTIHGEAGDWWIVHPLHLLSKGGFDPDLIFKLIKLIPSNLTQS